MARFIIVTFGFLAFAFYEMSGGADFDAEETRLSRIEVPVVPQAVSETLAELAARAEALAAEVEEKSA